MDTLGMHWTPYFSPTQRLFVSWQQGLVASLGAVMGVGFVIFLLYNPVKEDTVHHTAVVASEALCDIRLRARAMELSKDVVDNVLNDPKTLELVVAIAVKLLAQEDIKIAISSLLQSLFEDHYTQEITKKFVLKILRDPWIMEQIHVIAKEQTLQIIETKEVKDALIKLITESSGKMLDNIEVQHVAARAIRKSFIQAINPLR
ncbi:unnamed protein product [Phytomonas sp. Hart1]|nr:unnamed protein product [Phytomonas sp. Hart1]|eukprot:CCW67166.1 unnamed protein product [Phytomonas sp. isolate Hart1]